jgi:hypothetical protein
MGVARSLGFSYQIFDSNDIGKQEENEENIFKRSFRKFVHFVLSLRLSGPIGLIQITLGTVDILNDKIN